MYGIIGSSDFISIITNVKEKAVKGKVKLGQPTFMDGFILLHPLTDRVLYIDKSIRYASRYYVSIYLHIYLFYRQSPIR